MLIPGCNEKALWLYLKKGMGSRWDACRHEDSLQAGIPDVSYGCGGRCGWIELKAIPGYSKDGRAYIKNMRPAQIRWMLNRAQHGRYVWVIVRVGRADHFLIPAPMLEFIIAMGLPNQKAILEWNRELDARDNIWRINRWQGSLTETRANYLARVLSCGWESSAIRSSKQIQGSEAE